MASTKSFADTVAQQGGDGLILPSPSILVDATGAPITNANPLPVTSSGGGGGGAVTVADGADTTQGAKADSAVTNPASSASVVAVLKGLLTNTADLLADGDNLATIATNTTGLATDAHASTTATATGDLDTNLGMKADTAASSDTGTFSLLALFKRLLQGITSLVTNTGSGTTTTVGQTTVDTTSGGVTIGVNPGSRRRIVMKNLSTNANPVFVRPASVTTSNGFELTPGEALEDDTQAVWKAIVASGSQMVCWTEEV